MSKRWQMKESVGIVKVSRYAARLFLAAMIGLVSINFSPATAKADTHPVDLEIGGAGATSWNITNIKPADNGTKLVTLHNAGSRDGFVTIWLSDIISSEGMNPESETGDTAEPGEIIDHLLVGLKADGLTSGVSLPVIFNNLPRSVSAPGYIEVIPLKVGDTVNLEWQWELPAQTGNDVQGDGVSFTINYLLREFEITDLSDVVDSVTGIFDEDVTVELENGKGKLTIEEGTTGLTQARAPLSEIWLIEIDKEPSAPSEDTTTIGAHYNAGPDGTTFDQPVTITLTYDPSDMPERAGEADLVIALWNEDANQWIELEGSVVDPVNNSIAAPIRHFSRYTIISPVPPPPPSRGFIPPSPPRKKEQPPPVVGEEKRTTAVLETDMLGDKRRVGIEADGTLRQLFTLSDPDSQFVIEVDAGSKITDSDGIPLTRIELTLVEESITVPEDIVILSPTYELTGYINALESSQINFNPPARLTILYDPENLPENTFLPFIIKYTDEQGLVRLEQPPGFVVEIGKAKAEISQASLFTVVAELAPRPPPLPARFEASNLVINPGQSQPGQPTIISLTIANEGATAGSLELHLIIDGIVRMVKEIALAGNSSETLTFEVSNLATGKHLVKIAGLTEQFKIVSTTPPPGELRVNWLVLDVSVGAALVVGALVLYLVTRRSRQAESSGIEVV